MATYAAFKHVELFNVGKAKKRVLKPPGGGSSDIFGTNNANPVSTPRSVKNHLASNIFSNDNSLKNGNTGDHRRYPSNDSHNRLFGEADRPFTAGKNHLKSNIPIGGSIASDSTDAPVTNGKSTNNGVAHENGDKMNGDIISLNGNGVPKNAFARRRKLDVSPRSHISSSSPRSVCDLISPVNEGFMVVSSSMKVDEKHEETPIEKPNHLDISNEITTNDVQNSITSYNTSSSISPLTDDSSHTDSLVKPPKLMARNPVTGSGIEETYYRKPTRRMDSHRASGNPVTGEGYKKPPSEINTAVPSLNGAKQVINKNRVPPGGYSSGLW